MKILYVTTISNTLNAFLIPHIKMLIDQGHRVDVAFNKVQDLSPDLIELGCTVHNLEFQRSPLKMQNYIAYKKLKKLIYEEKYDLVHTHTPVASMIVRLVCMRYKNVKVFYTAHGFHFYKGAPLKNWLIYYPIEKLLSRYTDVIITINNEDYEIAKKKFKSKKVELLNGVGIDLAKFKPQTKENKLTLRNEYGYKDDDFILIYVGELSYRKNQDIIINAAHKLKEKIPDFKILLVGDGECKEEYSKHIENLCIEKQVELLGYRRDIANLMTLADVAISSSRQEGLPVNIMEAMAIGLPLVVTDCRGNRDLVINKKNGYVVGIDDVDGFVNALERIFLANQTRYQYSIKSLKEIQKYSLDNVMRSLGEIYKNSII